MPVMAALPRWRSNCRDGPQRIIVNCGGAAFAGGQVPARIEQGLRATAAHSTLVLDDVNSTAVLIKGKLGKGVEEVEINRRSLQSQGGAATRLEASHDGYVARYGLLHRRILIMRDDGSELRGEDMLVPQGARGSAARSVSRSGSISGRVSTCGLSDDGMGAGLALPDGAYWQFRLAADEDADGDKGTWQVEESMWVDGNGRPQPVQQLVIQGLTRRSGNSFSWLLKRMRQVTPMTAMSRSSARCCRYPTRPGWSIWAMRWPRHGVELISTGGTAKALRDAGLTVRDVSDLTGFPEMMDGRVKTLHPKVHGGLLAVRDDPGHAAAMEEHGIGAIDLVVVNLYPFEATVAKGADRAEIIENIDIGGPSMVRSAAKNHRFVTIVTDPADYGAVIEELDAGDGATSLAFRTRMAAKAYAATAAYDAAIANWFAWGDAFTNPLGAEALRRDPVSGHHADRVQAGRYAALRRKPASGGGAVSGAGCGRASALPQARAGSGQGAQLQQLQRCRCRGRTDCGICRAARRPSSSSNMPIPAALRAGTRCWKRIARRFECDSVSAFGGIIACNRPLDGPTAEAIAEIFTEVVVAPDADDAARAVFAKKKNLRLLLTGDLADAGARRLHHEDHRRRAAGAEAATMARWPRTT